MEGDRFPNEVRFEFVEVDGADAARELPHCLNGLSDRRVDLCGQRYPSGTIEVDGESSHRAMVHSELPISVLFYGQDGAQLFAMTNGPERRDPA
jgi:hypothetical protein